jgi:hypothetical protein
MRFQDTQYLKMGLDDLVDFIEKKDSKKLPKVAPPVSTQLLIEKLEKETKS